jgi:hypothetical protein
VFKIFGSIAVIALIVADTSLAPEELPAVVASAPNVALKGDRLDIGLHRTSCSYDEGECFGNSTGQPGQVRKVRVVPAERLQMPGEQPAALSQSHHSLQGRDRCVSLPPSCGSARQSTRAMI